MLPHQTTPIPLESLDLAGVRYANIFCSSPFFLRHALVLLANLEKRKVPVTLWSAKGGAVEPALAALGIQGTAIKHWPALTVLPRVSRPWTLLRTSRFFNRFTNELVRSQDSMSFYEEDYPEPSLHAIISRFAKHHRVYKFAYPGHDLIPSVKIPPHVLLRETLRAWAFGYPIQFFKRPGSPHSQYLPFFASSRLGVESVAVELDQDAYSPYLQLIQCSGHKPSLLLLESPYEEETCADYTANISILLEKLRNLGWEILVKGHPRLGSSMTINRLALPELDRRFPLEFYDLSTVKAIVGWCSSAMLTSAEIGIPTYSLEHLVPRKDATLMQSSIAFLANAQIGSLDERSIFFPKHFSELPLPAFKK